ncbi:hypothetical protein B0F90DRAFT_1273547 [Multifurca ochricompacta]|uniref:Uncharacterized protein n=1 Tax=Multifurca ochricompacta TaxID=376703 RepID=A0AAD4M9P6_9AGAM|nr:hypothetical protein B0F90DRAFT_1273547 [Multifurca ochricompacta]
MAVSQPAWQTDELNEEWPDQLDDGSDSHTRSISLTIPVGSLRAPIHSASDTDGADALGTFLIRQDTSSVLPQRTPGQRKGLIRDFFSPIPLERMFDPPSPKPSTLSSLNPSTSGRNDSPPSSPSSPVPPLSVTEASSCIGGRAVLMNRSPSNIASRDGWQPNMHCQFTFTVPNPAPSTRSISTSFTQANNAEGAVTPAAPLTDPPLRLFQFQYDTFTRDHLSAMVDSIAINSPSGSNTGNYVGNISSPFGLPTLSEASAPSSSIELRSAKRVKLSPVCDFTDPVNYASCDIPRPIPSKHHLGDSRSSMAIKNPRATLFPSTIAHATSSMDPDFRSSSFSKAGVGDPPVSALTPGGVHLLKASKNAVAAESAGTSEKKGHSSLGYRQQAESLMAQLKQDMKRSKRIFSTDATDSPPVRPSGVDDAYRSIQLAVSPSSPRLLFSMQRTVNSPRNPHLHCLLECIPYLRTFSRAPCSFCPTPTPTSTSMAT